MTAKNYLKESLSSILCFIIQGKGSSWKRFDPEILVCCNIAQIYTIEFFLFTHAIIANMLFVSKNCSLEKVAFMNSSCFTICVLDSFYGNSKALSCYSRKMFFRKGFEPEVHGNLTRLSFLSSRTQ